MLADIQGQEEGVRFLRRVAAGDLTSPLMLIGDEGVGRRFAITQLAKEMFCIESTRDSGCRCFACRQIDEGLHLDLITITAPDDKEIGVDQIRSVVEQADAYPSVAPVKIFLIDGADRMTVQASNALLKTLEEPPSSARFFLLAEEADRVIPTIRSRCGRVRFRRLPEPFVVERIRQFESDTTKSLVYARMAEGSVGRAIRFWGSGRIALRDRIVALLRSGVAKDLASGFSIISSLDKELPLGLRFLDQLLHDILMLRYEPTRMIHVDLIQALTELRERISDSVWHVFANSLRVLVGQSRRTRLNLAFHVQTLFVETFGI